MLCSDKSKQFYGAQNEALLEVSGVIL